MTAGRGLLAVLDQVGGLVDPAQAPAVAELARRLQLQRFRVLVVGEAKRGKSTLINAMPVQRRAAGWCCPCYRGDDDGDVRHARARGGGLRRRGEP
jgi:hypothetical protein